MKNCSPLSLLSPHLGGLKLAELAASDTRLACAATAAGLREGAPAEPMDWLNLSSSCPSEMVVSFSASACGDEASPKNGPLPGLPEA